MWNRTWLQFGNIKSESIPKYWTVWFVINVEFQGIHLLIWLLFFIHLFYLAVFFYHHFMESRSLEWYLFAIIKVCYIIHEGLSPAGQRVGDPQRKWLNMRFCPRFPKLSFKSHIYIYIHSLPREVKSWRQPCIQKSLWLYIQFLLCYSASVPRK